MRWDNRHRPGVTGTCACLVPKTPRGFPPLGSMNQSYHLSENPLFQLGCVSEVGQGCKAEESGHQPAPVPSQAQYGSRASMTRPDAGSFPPPLGSHHSTYAGSEPQKPFSTDRKEKAVVISVFSGEFPSSEVSKGLGDICSEWKRTDLKAQVELRFSEVEGLRFRTLICLCFQTSR